VAILSTGKRCPNAALPGSRFCGVPAHQELAKRDEAGEDLGDLIVKPGVVEAEDEGDDATADATAVAVSASQDEAEAGDSPAGIVSEGNAETPVAVSEETESAT
jgi:N utilization substance protein A